MDRLGLWHTFVRVVETGSFSAVAREMETTQPRVSKKIAALESQLGVRLLRRSTRKLSMTDEGERLYTEARRILEDVAEVELRLRGAGEPRGTLHVACPSAMSRLKLLPLSSRFVRRYPELSLDFSISDRFVDLIEEGIDVAIRIGEVANTDLHARRIGTARRICVAAPSYLKQHGTPKTPADLRAHQCIVYTLLATGSNWPFIEMPVKVSGRVRGNSPEALSAMVLDGLGIAMAPCWLFQDAVDDGRLRAILEDWKLPDLPIHALYQPGRYVPARIRVFVDFIAHELAQDAQLCI
jgi:DNA-binding transcriptional LysR family regulator